MSIDQHHKDHNASPYPNTSAKVSLSSALAYNISVYVIVHQSIWCLCITLQNDATSISQSASTTLSSHASSSTHSEEKWFDFGGRLESELNGFTTTCPQGASANGAVEAAHRNSKAKEKASAHWGEITSTCNDLQASRAHSETPLHTDLTENQAKSSLPPDTSSHTTSDATSHSRYTSKQLLCNVACNNPHFAHLEMYIFIKPYLCTYLCVCEYMFVYMLCFFLFLLFILFTTVLLKSGICLVRRCWLIFDNRNLTVFLTVIWSTGLY